MSMHAQKHHPPTSLTDVLNMIRPRAHPFSLLSLRMRSMTSWCHSCVPWHMFKRATFMPLMARVCSISSLQDRGPMVQMILVRRVLRKPAG